MKAPRIITRLVDRIYESKDSGNGGAGNIGCVFVFAAAIAIPVAFMCTKFVDWMQTSNLQNSPAVEKLEDEYGDLHNVRYEGSAPSLLFNDDMSDKREISFELSRPLPNGREVTLKCRSVVAGGSTAQIAVPYDEESQDRTRCLVVR